MAVLTPLTDDEAARLGARYGLDVVRARGILAGSVNSNYELALRGGGRVFARIYEEQTLGTAADEAALLDHLAARGVPTPRPLHLAAARPASGFVAEHAGKPVALFPWIDGEILCQARVDAGAARRVGEALARVHLAGASYAAKPGRFGPEQLAARLQRLHARPDLPPDVAALLPALDAHLAAIAAAPRRTDGLVHGDLFRDNVLFRGGEIVALLDFESASLGSFPFDLMVTVLAFCFGDRLERELARALAAGYAATRRPAPDELERLYDEARFAALRFTITRITDFELRPRGAGVYKDYRRFLARLDALDRLGPDGLLTLLGLKHSPEVA
ncbi:MAG TPA: homoserine kinase [Minicystis sp.]|nr:homoserine kinase [Minicystis sp.]